MIRQKFGEPVAFLDDRVTNRDAVVAAVGTPIPSIPVHVPGFSYETDTSDKNWGLSTFERSGGRP